MTYIDFHTHLPIYNDENLCIVDGQDTWGIHPCAIPAGVYDVPDLKHVIAIGECGLDKRCSTPFDRQLMVFQQHITLAEKYEKPLIIHCVRSIDDLLSIYRSVQPHQKWIVHGFHGKPQQLHSLLSVGMYVSFGFRYNEESLLSCPLDRMLLESDTDSRPIAQLYREVAEKRGISVEKLTHRMLEHLEIIFGHLKRQQAP